MKRKIVWITLTSFLLTSLVFTSCTTSTPTSTKILTSSQTTTSTTTVTQVVPKTTTVTTTSAKGNWWDKLGVPQYGGTLTIRSPVNVSTFDP